MRMRSQVLWTILLAAACVAGTTHERPNLHDSASGRAPQVTDLVLSADGRWLAAAYYVSAVNLPGTDWDAWVAVWDLANGKRTIVSNATSPLAISADGKWLAMGLYERSPERDWRERPRFVPALWKPGEVEPARKLASDLEPSEIIAMTFGADGTEVFALSIDGRLLARIGGVTLDTNLVTVP